tara:strand:+ start:651 stop:824 length:174 start_codon:yes stop_codon:yes gene_type:complete
MTNDWTMGTKDMYTQVKSVQLELQEKALREKHPDLKKAYEEYSILLEKYGFWDKINK